MQKLIFLCFFGLMCSMAAPLSASAADFSQIIDHSDFTGRMQQMVRDASGNSIFRRFLDDRFSQHPLYPTYTEGRSKIVQIFGKNGAEFAKRNKTYAVLTIQEQKRPVHALAVDFDYGQSGYLAFFSIADSMEYWCFFVRDNGTVSSFLAEFEEVPSNLNKFFCDCWSDYLNNSHTIPDMLCYVISELQPAVFELLCHLHYDSVPDSYILSRYEDDRCVYEEYQDEAGNPTSLLQLVDNRLWDSNYSYMDGKLLSHEVSVLRLPDLVPEKELSYMPEKKMFSGWCYRYEKFGYYKEQCVGYGTNPVYMKTLVPYRNILQFYDKDNNIRYASERLNDTFYGASVFYYAQKDGSGNPASIEVMQDLDHKIRSAKCSNGKVLNQAEIEQFQLNAASYSSFYDICLN